MRAMFACALAAMAGAGPDGADAPVDPALIAFGSCAKSAYPQAALWGNVLAQRPSSWLWTGDAAYSKEGDVQSQRAALRAQLVIPGYARLLDSGVAVHGVFDDHDFGVNDGGRHVPDGPARRASWRAFLGRADGEECRDGDDAPVYYAYTEIDPSTGIRVRVIVLDTRSYRDSHVIPSIGAWRPYGALLAAGIRWASTAVGMEATHEGDILGEAQWRFLESELARADTAFTVVVSSVQVLTLNPVLEGWMHFPRARSRLLRALADNRPHGLALISGDVHFAELLRYPPAAAVAGTVDEYVLEVTSSGLTHTCMGVFAGRACPAILDAYRAHRLTPEATYTGRNYGSLAVRADDNDASCGATMAVTVRDADTGTAQLVAERSACRMSEALAASLLEAAGAADARLGPGARVRAWARAALGDAFTTIANGGPLGAFGL